jgi:hypothetical protein
MNVVLVGLSIPMIGTFCLYGAAGAAILAPAAGAGMMLAVAQRRETALELPWSRMAIAALLAGGWCATFGLLMAAAGQATAVAVLGVACFPVGLVVARALPFEDLRRLMALLPRFRDQGPGAADLGELDERELALLAELIRDGRAPTEVASERGETEAHVLSNLVGALRRLTDLREPTAKDVEIGRYLLSPENVNLRDREGHLLALDKEVDPMELDELVNAAERVRRLRRRSWRSMIASVESDPGSSAADEGGGE